MFGDGPKCKLCDESEGANGACFFCVSLLYFDERSNELRDGILSEIVRGARDSFMLERGTPPVDCVRSLEDWCDTSEWLSKLFHDLAHEAMEQGLNPNAIINAHKEKKQ